MPYEDSTIFIKKLKPARTNYADNLMPRRTPQ